ncbi:MAG TPA: thrombospondin type 3 repeat-containing protein [Pseudomonadales bacterium]|nr:thrombospondin type 3 repeat-containing protein [Pseudomonadales bacterium]
MFASRSKFTLIASVLFCLSAAGAHASALDTDNDTLPDAWEIAHGLDPLHANYQISAGAVHSCALDDNGVQCWGHNGNGQTDVPALVNPVIIDSGAYHTCAIVDTGVKCWGYSDFGQTTPPALVNPTQISSGYYHTCALADGGVQCWGYNAYGQTDVPLLVNPVQVSAGAYHTCALDDAGIQCWGLDSQGETAVPALSHPTRMATGAIATCAIDDNGLHCWGDSSLGQTDVPALSNPTQVVVGSNHVCALDDSGVHCWGYNGYGQTMVPVLSNPVLISSQGDHNCALDDTGVHCWGANWYGQTDVPELAIDPDGDGIDNLHDNFPLDASLSGDIDGDGIDNLVDTDIDGDGVNNPSDNCKFVSNTDQLDLDTDGKGNACDIDKDGDTVNNTYDNCPAVANPEQLDTDADGLGNACDPDIDEDAILNALDNCPADWNEEQFDTDLDGLGDTCDATPNGDSDGDGVDELMDNCPLVANVDQANLDGDGLGDACDDDIDGDTIPNPADNCPLIWNENQANDDGDSAGNDCDALPLDATETVDTDGDGIGDHADAFPNNRLETTDTDGDGIGNNSDAFPNNSAETKDTDHDGIGNNADADDDNDGLSDAAEISTYHTNPLRKDTDGDTLPDAWELSHSRNPLIADYQIAASYTDICALDDNGVQCWGQGAYYGLHDVPALVHPRQIGSSVFANHACALDDNGVHCWGYNDQGQTNVPALVNPVQISVGALVSCALDTNGVHCWGESAYGQLDIPTLVHPRQVASGSYHTCALDENGVQCWGFNGYGQTDVPALVNPVQVSAGDAHTCALDDNGVHCWGYNGYGETDVPMLVNPGQVIAGGYHSCAIDDTGVHCWGGDWNGQSLAVPALVNPAALALAYDYSCVLDDHGLHCWGTDYGQIMGAPVLAINPDGDGLDGAADNCLLTANIDQLDTDRDGLGDACDSTPYGDVDFDGVGDMDDNCPTIPNASQLDTDNDGNGDVCDVNQGGVESVMVPGQKIYATGGDVIVKVMPASAGYTSELYLSSPLPGRFIATNRDAGTIVNLGKFATGQELVFSIYVRDTQKTYYTGPADRNTDNQLHAAANLPDFGPATVGFEDLEGGGDQDFNDNTFRFLGLSVLIDTDSDGIDNFYDQDDDNDGYLDVNDAFPLDVNEFVDTDGDKIGNNADTDDDNDGVPDANDAFPLNANETTDTDGDGIGNNADTDDDGDTITDGTDNCPAIYNFEQLDADHDGTGDACDPTPNGVLDGTLDTAFNPGSGVGGIAVYSSAIQSDGKVVIAGDFTSVDGVARNAIARLNNDGSLDNSFNPGTGVNGFVLSAAWQADGKIIIGGNFTAVNGVARNSIARLNSNGSLDNSFNPGSGANNYVYAVAIQTDGKIILGGNFNTINGTSINRIARLNNDGSLDTTFNPGTGANNWVKSVAIQPDGKIIIGGAFTFVNDVAHYSTARLNSNGSLDASFIQSSANNYVWTMALQTDGKIVIGGLFTSVYGQPRNRIARLNNNGSLDTSFNPGAGASDSVIMTALQADGKILLSGNFFLVNNETRNYIARLNSDGSVDATFNPGTSTNAPIYSIALQHDDRVIIGGNFTGVDGLSRNRIARLFAASDVDSDGLSDFIDTDDDNDTVLDETDNCPVNSNTNQLDADHDGFGDACDPHTDSDADSVVDVADNCPLVANINQINSDNDAQGDACDNDDDNDTVLDGADNCPLLGNSNQLDTDSDGLGDVCDPTPIGVDTDGDGVGDAHDAFPTNPCATTDTDADGKPDSLLTCQPEQLQLAADSFETGNLAALSWTTGGNAGWSVQSSEKKDGVFSARTGALPAGTQKSWLQLNYTSSTAGKISFWVYFKPAILSQSKINFYLDGINKNITGTYASWKQFTIDVSAGSHAYKWEYAKNNNSISSSVEYALLDSVRVTGISLAPTLTQDNCPLIANPDRYRQ